MYNGGMRKFYLDSETIGFHSMMVLFQYAIDDGPIHLHSIWGEPVHHTLDLFREMCDHSVVGFNLTFDWFHIAKISTIWSLLPGHWIPKDHIDEIAMLEPLGRDGPAIKPRAAMDLLLHSRTGPYQSLMSRKAIRIRKVPIILAQLLATKLAEVVELDDIYFAKYKNKTGGEWVPTDRIDPKTGERDPHFQDVVLTFNPAAGLKFLAEHALGVDTKYLFKDVMLDMSNLYELGYSPTALSLSSPENGWKADKFLDDSSKTKWTWPALIHEHIQWWENDTRAREYARDDIVYTRGLDKHFGEPEPGDNNSELACMVGVNRWRGYKIDPPALKSLLKESQDILARAPIEITKVRAVRKYITDAMDETEVLGCKINESTGAAILESIANEYKIEVDDGEKECAKCQGLGCPRCLDTGAIDPHNYPMIPGEGNHPAATRAKEVLLLRKQTKQIELYEKLLLAGRFHTDYNVVGTLSNRMAGSGGLNPQGINSLVKVRSCFPLAWDGAVLSGGDFDSFEITIADKVYADPDLRLSLLQDKKIHAFFGMAMFPDTTYEEVCASEGSEHDMYTMGKSGVFGLIYGGNWSTLVKNFGISKEDAQNAEKRFFEMFPGIPKAREKTINLFCSMTQPGGLGTKVIWKDPADYIESFMGFRRFFTLENKITKALFDLANSIPSEWHKYEGHIARRKGKIQTPGGATQSAIYSAAFQLQAANMRAACNHEIQSPGADLTKDLQRALWDLQPVGIHKLVVSPGNIHDEITCVNDPELTDTIAEVVEAKVISYRKHVPLIGITWFKKMENWASKKTGNATGKVKIGPDKEKLLKELVA